MKLPLELQCRAAGLPEPVREFRFHDGARKWRLDYAWPAQHVALEREGIVYTKGDYRAGGRHASVKGFREDTVKYGEAFRMGWRVLRCLPSQIDNGQALRWLLPILKREL